MNASLPDTARHLLPSHSHSLDWVGMENIRLPLQIAVTDAAQDAMQVPTPVSASVDLGIDLPGGEGARKGIHMSRLYRALLALSGKPLTVPAVLACLKDCVASHEDCNSDRAAITIRFDLLLSRPALLTEQAAGWQGYMVELSAAVDSEGQISLYQTVEVTYSSTCPCSAALSRQALSEHFSAAFAADGVPPDVSEVSQWLQEQGSIATPHSQRSVAKVTVAVPDDSGNFALQRLIDQIESSLQTPVQTFVKRADEQAFALRNGSNLMYVEDASRRILDAVTGYRSATVEVRHFESLHGHDAVAKSYWVAPAAGEKHSGEGAGL